MFFQENTFSPYKFHFFHFFQIDKFSFPTKKASQLKLKRLFFKLIQFSDAFYSKMPTFSFFSKIRYFFQKNIYFFEYQNSVLFEKFCYFSRILRQVFYKLVVRDFQTQNWTLASSRTLSIGKNVKK